nr:MAP7 domain-containing protein 1 [Ipomoea batatas]
MEYERIHKVQTGIISPSKLRMKLVGAHFQRKKGDGSNSNCNSSRTSPSKVGDSEFVKNSLLASESGDVEEEASRFEATALKSSGNPMPNEGQGDLDLPQTKDNAEFSHVKMHHVSKAEGSNNSSSVHPLKAYEDENLDYDSTSSFEFHKGERSMHHHSIARSFSRPMPSKWNDAEKWIMNRQTMQANQSKKVHFQNQANRIPAMNIVRVAPESTSFESKLAVKRVDFCQPPSHIVPEKFAFSHHGSHPISGPENIPTALIDLCPESNNLPEMDDERLACTNRSTGDREGLPAIRSVSMRDMGTEMTPIPSQEPSRTATPIGATTPLRSPTSSIPSTPRRGDPTACPIEHAFDNISQHSSETGKKELSEQELKLKTRKEILSLGMQLGKMNIAAWASKDEKERSSSAAENDDTAAELEQIEFVKRAAAWEDAEKSKHTARFKREEIKIQAWESQHKAKLEAEMRRIEAQVEQMRAQAQAKMVKKVAMARQKSEEKRATAEARKYRQAEKTAAQAEYIRQTGRLPSSSSLSCCGW